MTITVNIGDADLSELLAKVEAGEEIILVRDGVSVARIAAVTKPASSKELIETIFRERSGRQPVTQAEIAEWKQIGRR
ncbi:type II toxin-antitoxin system prevent-host-death family antitoxin [Neorhizobium lilium]|uniref:Type II toxin-antitoxin system prevent-host-death family antitoxin n=1 Tax=Neorhizobium lilium TaxID=2503024 RepID=A0A3S3TVK1_9HYPH|nr:type II toxin-antitoxin system prevent-host-death family antitoxin [Neorhizobium lilium]RWX75840.1 type II toxin-antitoxin system prevent-host-death family antitoxin [Neorhizobium lilium]